MSTLTRKDFLSIGVNKRLVEAVEYLAEQNDVPVNRKTICQEIGFDFRLYSDIKKNIRGLPARYVDKAGLVLLEHGISSDWFIYGRGPMTTDKYILKEDSLLIEMYRNELRAKEKLIDSLRDQLKEALAKLSAQK